jgi:hypothetical protein
MKTGSGEMSVINLTRTADKYLLIPCDNRRNYAESQLRFCAEEKDVLLITRIDPQFLGHAARCLVTAH